MEVQQDFSVQAHGALKKYFGYDSFRGQQLNIVQHVLNQQDGLVIMSASPKIELFKKRK